MENKKVFSFKKMNLLGKIGIMFALIFWSIAIITLLSFLIMINVGVYDDEILIKNMQKWIINLVLSLVKIYAIFNLVITSLFVKGILKSKTLVGILNLIILYPGILILIGEGEVEEKPSLTEN